MFFGLFGSNKPTQQELPYQGRFDLSKTGQLPYYGLNVLKGEYVDECRRMEKAQRDGDMRTYERVQREREQRERKEGERERRRIQEEERYKPVRPREPECFVSDYDQSERAKRLINEYNHKSVEYRQKMKEYERQMKEYNRKHRY